MKYTQDQKLEAFRSLREIVKPGDTIYTQLHHVSQSGMSRVISMYVIKDNKPINLDYWYCVLDDSVRDKKYSAIKVGGAGMDMGYQLVYNLAYYLYQGDFTCIGEGCPSNDHANGDRDYTIGKIHSDGGYALKHQWL